ncbi:ExbD/TolR family protein [Marinicella gelatinilytica]|uniref:ExbD/TolR family protein n=1 Tax=Marinicella gelatinilytica TaxID=2996017 RepID=UPI002260A203|nr:biopolymer transporter ExbD [Marinicella gelatinilytica]MCX7544750.1 biopolymer transporter ExbD [Marinicella gelatinilytica]
MKFSTEDNNSSRLNLTSLIDVVFLLLIFFMVSTTFEKQSKLKIELPEASQQTTVSENQNIIITINAKGTYYINDRELSNQDAKALQQQLVDIAGDDRDMKVLVKADANASHKYVVTVLDVLGQLGFEGIAIATTENKQP